MTANNGILDSLDPSSTISRRVIRRVTKIGTTQDEEAFNTALMILERVRLQGSPLIIKTWEHSSARHSGGPRDGELVPPADVPEQLFTCLVALLFDREIIDGLRVLTGYCFIMTPSPRQGGLAIWPVPSREIGF